MIHDKSGRGIALGAGEIGKFDRGCLPPGMRGEEGGSVSGEA